LFRRTQGHALFTVELLRAMYERGDLWQDEEGQWIEREAIDWTTLPVKVEGAIEKRIERLSEASQAILTIASIEGETFTAEIVAHVQGLDERTLVQQLSRELDKQHRLVTAEAIRWLDPGRQRVSIYRFRHQLFQHYLYHRLDEVERGYLHESVGTVLEQLYAGRTKEVAGQLAWHFEQACLASKAIHYLQEAGQAAADAYANTEAIAHYSRAIELAENDGIGAVELAHLYIRLGGLLLITKGDAALEVRRAFGRAFELYQQAGESPQLFTALKGLAMYHKLRGESETARRLTDQIMVLANSLQDPMFMVEACFAMGSLFYYAGEFAPAQEYLERGINSYDLEQYRSLTMLYDQDPGVASLSYASMNLWMLGYPGRALVQCSESLALAEELSHPYSLVMALIWNGWVHLFRREGRLVEERTEAAISLSEEYDFALFSAVGMLLRGWALTMRGEVEEGIMQMKQGLSMSAVTIQNQGGEYLPPQLICPLADAHGDVGQPEEGLQAIVKAQTQMNKDRGWLFVEAEIYRLKGKLLLLRDGSENEIEANFQQAIDISRQQEAKSLELRGATSLARLWVSQGKQEEARQLLAPVYGWFSQGFDTLDLIEAKALLDELS
jgi:predicted ATPase